jgi:hypothetical protein
VHYPWAPTVEGRAGAVGTDCCHYTIFGDVAVGVGKHPLREPAARAGRPRICHGGSHQQIHGILGDHSAAAARHAVTRRGRAYVQRTDRIDPTIFQDPNVRIGRCRVKLHRYSVRAGCGSQNFLRVILWVNGAEPVSTVGPPPTDRCYLWSR